MEKFFFDFGNWVVTSIIAIAGLMIWGRINDKFVVLQKKVDAMEAEHENTSSKLGTMELNIVNKIGELKDALDKKYVSKEVCAFYHKGE